MRLLRIEDQDRFSLVEYVGKDIPKYTILSHTWLSDDEEVTFRDLLDGTGKDKEGYRKIRFCAQQTALDGLKYFWVDTCCIDKSSSSELTEAINSMFRWYQKAQKCYVYLSDISVCGAAAEENDSWRRKPDLKKSRWFTRGWTLQELIAPNTVEFFSRDKEKIGTKGSLEQTIHEMTGIEIAALRGSPLAQFSIDERMSWAAKRQTKREEDEAYCLLGIFNVSMPLIYGEGREKALQRLRKKIKSCGGSVLAPLTNEEKIELLLASLRFDEIDSRQMTIKIAHAETCQWFLSTSQYLDWIDDAKLIAHHGFLWIKGHPGTGKSTIMKFAFNHAQSTMDDRILVSFFFNARGADLEKSTLGTYRSLLLQLLEKVPELQREILPSLGLTDKTIRENYQWTVESLKAVLSKTIRQLGQNSVMCFIDALDECEERQIREMVSFLEQISDVAVSASIRFRVCFASRHYPNVTIRRGQSLILERQEGHRDDITKYVSSELKIGTSQKSEKIREELQRKASGIFMWVVLVVEILNKEYDRGRMHALQKRLQEIPGDLHQLFHDILTRDSYNKDELVLCIQWVLFARRPLSPEELYYAILSNDPDNLLELDREEVTMEVIRRLIIDSSKGLVQFTESSQPKVQFIHESMKDFLLKDNGLIRIFPHLSSNFQGQSHEQLKRCCINYLNDKITHAFGPRSLVLSMKEAARLHPKRVDFMDYVVESVLYHANMAAGYGISQGFFLEKFPLDYFVSLENNHTESVSLLYLLAEGNMSNLIRIHPSNLKCLEVEKDRCGTPLFAAISKGNTEAIQAFLEAHSATETCEGSPCVQWKQYRLKHDNTGRFNDTFVFSNQRTTLSYLAEFGDETLFGLGLSIGGVLPHTKDSEGTTPLWWAVKLKRDQIVRQLLDTGKVDINSRYRDDFTVLTAAVWRGHHTVVKLLLDLPDIDVNARDADQQTALLLAAENGNEAVVTSLLDTGKVDVGARGYEELTALSWAAIKGHTSLVRLFLDIGKFDLDSVDINGRTALMLAAYHGREDVVQMLLDTGSLDVNSKDMLGRTPLSLASGQGKTSVVRQLLRRDDIDVNTESRIKRVPLAWAARKGHPFVVGELLKRDDINVNARDRQGWTALTLAANEGMVDSVFMLVRSGKADLNLGYENGQTALSLAAEEGHERVVRLLLKTEGVNRNVKDIKGRTETIRAARKGRQNIIKLLLSTGEVQLNVVDADGKTALQWAIEKGHDGIVKLLSEAENTTLVGKEG